MGAYGRAFARIYNQEWTGFVRMPEGHYERFEETVFNTAFALDAVRTKLGEAGFQRVYCARVEDLATPIEDPEGETRVFVVARR